MGVESARAQRVGSVGGGHGPGWSRRRSVACGEAKRIPRSSFWAVAGVVVLVPDACFPRLVFAENCEFSVRVLAYADSHRPTRKGALPRCAWPERCFTALPSFAGQ